MTEFERRGFPLLERYHVRLGQVVSQKRPWRGQKLVVHKTEGQAPFLFSNYEFSAAWAAYPAYEGGCLIYATVVLWEGHPRVARQLLERFVQQGIRRVKPLTETIPYRH